MRLTANAPRHWPQISVDDFDRDNLATRCVQVGAALKKAFEANGLGAHVRAFLQYYLFDNGVLQVPIEVEEEGQIIPVFVYGESNAEAAAHFTAARKLLKEKGQSAVYYCPEPIGPAGAGAVLGELGPHVFSRFDGEMVKGEYAMWWPSEEHAKFTESPARVDLDRIFPALDGLEPYLFTAFVVDLELTQEPPTGIINLPEEPFVLPVEGPDKQRLFFLADQEKGLSFAFHTEDTAPWYRDTFLRLFADFVERFTGELAKAEAQRLPQEQRQALGWWTMLVSFLEKKEAESSVSPKVCVIRED